MIHEQNLRYHPDPATQKKLQEEQDKHDGLVINPLEQEIEAFWKMLDDNRFVKTTNSITNKEEILNGGIVDMEAIVLINGEFDKYAIEDFLRQFCTRFTRKIVEKAMVEEKANIKFTDEINQAFFDGVVEGCNSARSQILENIEKELSVLEK